MRKIWLLLLSLLCLCIIWCWNNQNDKEFEFSMKEKCNKYSQEMYDFAYENTRCSGVWNYGVFYSKRNNTCLWYAETYCYYPDSDYDGQVIRIFRDMLDWTLWLNCHADLKDNIETDKLTVDDNEILENFKCYKLYNKYMNDEEDLIPAKI